MDAIKILILLSMLNNAVICVLLLKNIDCLKSILYDVENSIKEIVLKDKE